jgi:hypothetical protein
MNKRGLIKYTFLIIAAAISFYFMITSDTGFEDRPGILALYSLPIAITVFMFVNKNKIKKFKFIYDVTLMLLIIACALFLGFLCYDQISCYFDVQCSPSYDAIFLILYPTVLFTMIFLSFNDINNKTNKTNDILTIVISSLIILIHLRYYFEPNFVDKLIKGDIFNDFSSSYITQNYIYFTLMYLIVLIHNRVNKV